MSWYDGVNEAQPGGGGNYLEPGIYVLESTAVKHLDKTQKGGTFFVAEFRVLESSNPKCPVGASVSHAIRLNSQFPQQALGDVKALVGALFGIRRSETDRLNKEITGQTVSLLTTTEGRAVKGRKVRAEATNRTTKSGGQFTRIVYEPADPNDAPIEMAPAAPPLPAPPPAPSAKPFPPEGWTAHPQAPGFYYRGQEVKSEADLRSL